MDAANRIRRPLLLTVAIAFTGVACLTAFLSIDRKPELNAAPHLMSSPAHPYDPDWPQVQFIIQTKCIGCHRADTDRQDFTTYEDIIASKDGDTPLIIPGKPEDSMFFDYLAWNVHADVDCEYDDSPMMPEDKNDWLTAGQLEAIERWIRNGALQYKLPDGCNIQPLTEMDFPSAKVCKQCHPKQYEEWSRSMHAYAQNSPVFEAFNLAMQERTHGTIDTFCTRCHTPIGTALGENGLRRNVNRSRISLESVTCVVCHKRAFPQYKNNGRLHIEPSQFPDGCMFGPFDDSKSEEAKAHKSAGLPYMKSSQFCGECHDVTSPAGVRLEEAFSEWQNSPAAKAGITCQQCHMGPVPGVPTKDCERPLGPAAILPGVKPEDMPQRRLTDHTFAGPDHSMLPDTEFPEKLDWMYEQDYRDAASLTPHQQKSLYELRLHNRKQLAKAAELRKTLLRNAADIHVHHSEQGVLGRWLTVRVDVESLTAGHNLPTGFTAERQVWVEVVVRDPTGKIILHSGDLDSNGDLRDEHSHAVLTGKTPVDPFLLNFQNKFTARTQKGNERTVVLSVNRHLQPINIMRPATEIAASFGRPSGFRIAKGSLPPLATIGQTYSVRATSCPGTYFVSVRLNFRNLPPHLLDKIGVSHLKHLLEVVPIRTYEGVINVHSAR